MLLAWASLFPTCVVLRHNRRINHGHVLDIASGNTHYALVRLDWRRFLGVG